jgi:hypothetical protein
MNLLQARLPLNLNRYIASIVPSSPSQLTRTAHTHAYFTNARTHTQEKRSARLLQAKLVPPVLLPACYDCNCPWNPWPEDEKDKEREYVSHIPQIFLSHTS